MLVTCLNCSNEFDKKPFEIKKSPRHFCSRSCSAQLNNRGKTKNPPKPHSCKMCGQTFYRNSRIARRSKTYCPPCYDSKPEDRNLTLRDIGSSAHLKGKHPSWKWTQVRYFARSWNSSAYLYRATYVATRSTLNWLTSGPFPTFPKPQL